MKVGGAELGAVAVLFGGVFALAVDAAVPLVVGAEVAVEAATSVAVGSAVVVA